MSLCKRAILLLGCLACGHCSLRVGQQRRLSAALEEELITATMAAAGKYHTCAISAPDRGLVCWGQNYDGQTDVPADLGPVLQVAAGGYHTCATREADNSVACWGWDSLGQASVPSGLGPVAQLVAGHEHNCAVRAVDSIVECWGSNDDGQLTAPSTVEVAQVAAGDFHTCAIIKADRTLMCWGLNSDYQVAVPVEVGAAVQVAAGLHHTFAISEAGSLSQWGWDTTGQSFEPDVFLGARAAGVFAYFTGACVALEPTRSLTCMGLPQGSDAAVPSDLGAVAAVAVGGFHACAVRAADRSLRCWGADNYGQVTVPPALLAVAAPGSSSGSPAEQVPTPTAEPAEAGASATTQAPAEAPAAPPAPATTRLAPPGADAVAEDVTTPGMVVVEAELLEPTTNPPVDKPDTSVDPQQQTSMQESTTAAPVDKPDAPEDENPQQPTWGKVEAQQAEDLEAGAVVSEGRPGLVLAVILFVTILRHDPSTPG